MHPKIPLLLVLGLLLGPAYYGYCLYLSGDSARSVAMTERGDRWVLPDGSILRFHNGLAYRPVELDLKPDMNLVGLRLHLEFPENTGNANPSVQYQATLQQPGGAAIERPIRVSAKPGTRTAEFGTVEIFFAGRYLFLLEEVGKPAITPKLTLEVREHIESPNQYVVWTGIALLLGALALQLYWLVRQQRQSRNGR